MQWISLSACTVAARPVILTLEQTSLTSVRLEWGQSVGGAPVTVYGVHYSDGVSPRIKVVLPPTTSADITGLTTGSTYTFSVEAGSEELSAESEEAAITLGESGVWPCGNYMYI